MNKETPSHSPDGAYEPTWSRRQFLWGSAGLTAAGLVGLFGRNTVVSAVRNLVGSPVMAGKIHVYQFDYYFVPNYMTWRVGNRMEVVLQNQSHTHWHEWTIGRHPHTDIFQGFGRLTSDGWSEDFWDGVRVTLSDPYKVDNFVPSEAKVTYIGPKQDYQIASGGVFSPTLQPGGSLHLSFTVPDKPGIWHYGCFVQQFIHFRAGMRGTINILPA